MTLSTVQMKTVHPQTSAALILFSPVKFCIDINSTDIFSTVSINVTKEHDGEKTNINIFTKLICTLVAKKVLYKRQILSYFSTHNLHFDHCMII